MTETKEGSGVMHQIEPPNALLMNYSTFVDCEQNFYGIARDGGGKTLEGKVKIDYKTLHGKIPEEAWVSHIYGRERLVVSLIRDSDNRCKSAVLDIDQYSGLDHSKIARFLDWAGFKAQCFQSKSKGLHIYFHFNQWLSAKTVIQRMQDLSFGLQFLGEAFYKGSPCEIFPKQDAINLKYVNPKTQKLQPKCPSCINLPFFGRECGYFNSEGTLTDFQSFIADKPNRIMSEQSLDKWKNLFSKKAKASKGSNDLLWNWGRYFYEIFPDKWKEKVRIMNDKFPYFQMEERRIENSVIRSIEKAEGKYSKSNEVQNKSNGTQIVSNETEQEDEIKVFLDSDIVEAKIPKRQDVLRGRVPASKQQGTCITATGGGSKSTLATQLACQIITGMTYGETKVEEMGNILLYNAEESKAEMEKRINACKKVMGIKRDSWGDACPFTGVKFVVPEFKIHLISGLKRKLVFMNQEWDSENKAYTYQLTPDVPWIINYCKKHNIIAVVFDPIVSLHTLEENNNNAIDKFASQLNKMFYEADVVGLITTHTNKMNESGSEDFDDRANANRGASSLINSMRRNVTLKTMEKKECASYEIPVGDRGKYVCVRHAKDNYQLMIADGYWFKRSGQTLTNGENVGALEETNLHEVKQSRIEMKEKEKKENAIALHPIIKELIANYSEYSDKISIQFLGKHFDTNEDKDAVVDKVFGQEDISFDTIKLRLEKMFKGGIVIGNERIRYAHYSRPIKNTSRWIVMEKVEKKDLGKEVKNENKNN